jgi:WD40 repeat protein
MKNNTPLPLLLMFLLSLFSNASDAQITQSKEILWTADWSPDGKYMAIGGNTNALQLYTAKDLTPYLSFPIANTITRVKWHPTENIVVVTTQMSGDKSSIINLDTNEKMELTGISADGARGADWNYTGEYLAIADNDGQILIYNTRGELLNKFINENNSTKGLTALDWHPKKNILTVVGDKIRLFDMEGNLLTSIQHRPEEVLLLSVAWHPSGAFFATGDYGDDIDASLLQYWSEQGDLLYSTNISKGEYRNMSWNRKGTRLATASDALRIWDSKGNLIAAGSSPDYLWGVAWNKKGNKIITSSLEQNIILWNGKAEKIGSAE